MINKEQFIELIQGQLNFDKHIDKIDEVLNCNFFESILVEYAASLFDKYLKLIFNKNGVDDVYWWMYEKDGRSDYKMWDKDGNEIQTETIDDLWEIVKSEQNA